MATKIKREFDVTVTGSGAGNEFVCDILKLTTQGQRARWIIHAYGTGSNPSYFFEYYMYGYAYFDGGTITPQVTRDSLETNMTFVTGSFSNDTENVWMELAFTGAGSVDLHIELEVINLT